MFCDVRGNMSQRFSVLNKLNSEHPDELVGLFMRHLLFYPKAGSVFLMNRITPGPRGRGC